MRAFQFLKLALALVLVTSSINANAGVDIYGQVQRVQIAGDGTLWFAMDATAAATFCKPGWNTMTMYVPATHPQYRYYYAMLLSAVSMGKRVLVANISVFNGSTSCDITQTGYGLTLLDQ